MKIFGVGTRSVLFGAHCFWLHPLFVASAWTKLYGFPTDWRLWVAFYVHDLGYVGKPNMDGPEGEAHVEWGANFMHRLADKRNVQHEFYEWYCSHWGVPWRMGSYVPKDERPADHDEYHHKDCDKRFNEMLLTGWDVMATFQGDNTLIVLRRPVRSTEWRDLCLYHSRFYAKRDEKPFSLLCVADKLAVAMEPWWLYLPRVILSGEIYEYLRLAGGQEGSKYNGEPFVSPTSGTKRTKRQWFDDMTRYMREWVEEHKDGRQDTWTPAPTER